MNKSDLITIGKIVAPHGVRGDVRIVPETDFPERFLTMEHCYINGTYYEINSVRFHKHFILMTFAEIADRNEAECLINQEIQITEDELTELPEGRYYIFEIIGLEVFDTAEQYLGTVSEVLQPGANDVYVVSKEDEPDLLLPVIDDVIIDINLESGRMIVNPPEWI